MVCPKSQTSVYKQYLRPNVFHQSIVVDVDGRAVEADPHHIIIEDPDGSCTLILDNMTADDSGQYMCFATSSAGNASTLGKITVQGEWRTV